MNHRRIIGGKLRVGGMHPDVRFHRRLLVVRSKHGEFVEIGDGLSTVVGGGANQLVYARWDSAKIEDQRTVFGVKTA